MNLTLWTLVLQFYQPTRPFLKIPAHPKNDDSKQDFAIGNSIVRSEGLPTKAIITDEGHLARTFYSKTVFNLSQRALSDIEIQVFEKGLDFSPVRRSFNEPEF